MIPTSDGVFKSKITNTFQRIPKPLGYPLAIAIVGGVFSGLVEQYQIPHFPPSAWLDNTFIVMATTELYRQLVPYLTEENTTLPKLLSLAVGFYVALVGYLPLTTYQGSVALYPAGTFVVFYSVRERNEYKPIEITILGALFVISTTTLLRTLIYLFSEGYLNPTLVEAILLIIITIVLGGIAMIGYGIYRSEITNFHIILYGLLMVLSAGSFISMGQILYDLEHLTGWTNIFAAIVVVVYTLVGFLLLLYVPYKTVRGLYKNLKNSIK